MSKLPVVSGAQCVKALGKIGFELHRQRGSHIVLVRETPPAQTTIPNHKELDQVRYAQSSGKPVSPLMSSSHCCELRYQISLLTSCFTSIPVLF